MAESEKEGKEEKEEKEEKEGKKKSPIMLIVIIVAAALIIGGGGAITFMMLKVKGGKDQGKQAEKEEEVVKPETLGKIVKLDPFVVNLQDGNNYLKIDTAFELSNEDVEEEIKNRTPQIRDAILLILSSKALKDVKTSQGKIVLKDELLTRVNGLLGTGLIKNIYFTSFVIQ